MRVILNIICWLILAQCAMAQGHDVDSIALYKSSSKTLQEVVVNASYMFRENDHILVLPTREQRTHAFSGYDLLRNLMIPGVIIDSKNNTVSTPVGSASLYIDGREATDIEIQSLRSKDIVSIEYYDVPTGKYAKDAAAINFVMKKMTNGGYTQIDALQGVGFLNGDYNLVSKYTTGSKNLTLWGGYAVENPKSSCTAAESFSFPSPVIRNITYDNADNRSDNGYLQASISNRGKSIIWMLRGGIAWDKDSHIYTNGSINHGSVATTASNKTIDRSMRPSLYFYGLNNLSSSLTLDYTIDSYYARNHHNRSYLEGMDSYENNVKENYYYLKVNTNLIRTLRHNNRLAFNIYEFFRASHSNYTTLDDCRQNLQSSETIIFADYSQRLNKFFYDINPGISIMNYRLKGSQSINHVNPRLQLRSAYMISKGQQLQLSFALGNTYPRINTINNITQQLDPIIMLQGNPDLDNSMLLNPRISYNLNLSKITLQTGLSYFYQTHAIISDYYVSDNYLISSFRDDATYSKPELDISVTYKPMASLNMNVSGRCSQSTVKSPATYIRVTDAMLYGEINYYMGEFLLSVSVNTPQRRLLDYQTVRTTGWQYQLTAMWKHGQWGAELSVNNPLIMSNKTTDNLESPAYTLHCEDLNRRDNQYVTIKLVYNVEYGKKAAKSPDYQHISSESAILK